MERLPVHARLIEHSLEHDARSIGGNETQRRDARSSAGMANRPPRQRFASDSVLVTIQLTSPRPVRSLCIVLVLEIRADRF
jgi:hypothetical protein